jgi:hypothetical protein
MATHANDWFYSDSRAYRIERYDAGGELRGVYTRSLTPPPATEADLERFLDRIRGERPEPTRFDQMMRAAPLPERMPAYERLAVDALGNLWALRHGGADPARCWDVWQKAPPLLAEACLPERFTVLDIGETSILGVLRDELDVERVALYRLAK